jgi:hypothetical protein
MLKLLGRVVPLVGNTLDGRISEARLKLLLEKTDETEEATPTDEA